MLHYWARERGRLVIDPDTSRVYLTQLARHYYLSLGEGNGGREMGAEMSVEADVPP
jgi:hypothetical protein